MYDINKFISYLERKIMGLEDFFYFKIRCNCKILKYNKKHRIKSINELNTDGWSDEDWEKEWENVYCKHPYNCNKPCREELCPHLSYARCKADFEKYSTILNCLKEWQQFKEREEKDV